MIKTKNMKRKIPVFKINMEPGSSYSQLKDIPGIKQAIIEETVYAIKEGINNKKNIISLFEIANTNYLVDLKKEKWKPTLETALEYFIEQENYAKCIEIRDLKDRL